MTGRVVFVGAGPGALDLLTLRAVRALQECDVVLHDELVPHDFVTLLRAGTAVVNVGKRCGRASMTQETINRLLVKHAQAGRRVVRLKCGDPAIFGRLGEEMQALRDAGVRFEIVPGVTAAVAAAAAAQITLTARGVASRVTFATASLADHSRQEWRRCLEDKATLVIYMPGRDYAELANALRGAGARSDDTCAVVARAGCDAQQVYYTSVDGLQTIAAFASPAVVIVGELARDARQEQATELNRGLLNDELCAVLAAANETIQRRTTWQSRT
jgi:uroporphyrin-III C-methyltransferase